MATRDWRHEDRFGSRERDNDRRYGIGRFEQHPFTQPRDERDRFESDDDSDDDNRGWFDRVRDTASRWFHRDDDDERDERERDERERDERERDKRLRDERLHHADAGHRPEQRYRDDADRRNDNRNRMRSRQDDDNRMRSWQDEDNRGHMRRNYDDYRGHMRSWQDDDNRGRTRSEHDDNRARQFASYRDDDDRSGQFNRLHDERGTLGRRGDIGPSSRTRFDRYDERGRFSGFAGEDRHHFGDGGRGRPLGDERHTYERQRQYGRDRSWADRELGRYERDDDERAMHLDRGPHAGYGREEHFRPEREQFRPEREQFRPEREPFRREHEPQFRSEREPFQPEREHFRPEHEQQLRPERGYAYERDRGWDRQQRDRGRSMRGRDSDDRDDGRFAPGRQEHVEHDDSLRRGMSRLSDRSRRR